MAGPSPPPYEPPLTFRFLSALTMGSVGAVSRSFLYALNRTETHGLDDFLELLDQRKDERKRERGLLTVSNHTSVLDDPLIWGVLPFRYHYNPGNLRWSLGSYDICFKHGQSGLLSSFFTYGNTLPTQRAAHSPYGGLFQPTITQCIRLLSDPYPSPTTIPSSSPPPHLTDPFTDPAMTYTTNGTDIFPAPAAYPSRRHSWVHIFPEGMIHQHPSKTMRYFKWGVARLILEAEPCPDVLPLWIDGPQEVMNERRTWPRGIPRAGKEVTVAFGQCVDAEKVFGGYRERWRELRERTRRKRLEAGETSLPVKASAPEELGVVEDDELRYGPEAQQLRIEVTLAVRNEVLKVRRSLGLPDEDPKHGLAETFRREGPRKEGEMKDQSVVKDM